MLINTPAKMNRKLDIENGSGDQQKAKPGKNPAEVAAKSLQNCPI
jgi:hypothetical protein